MTPRRFGKTWAVSMFVAALALNVPGILITIFSTGKRASNSLMGIALRFINGIPGARERICKQTSEELYMSELPLPAGKGLNSPEVRRIQSLPSTSRIQSFPSSVKGVCVCVCACVCVCYQVPPLHPFSSPLPIKIH